MRELIEAHVTEQGFYIVHEDPTNDELRAHQKVVKLDWRGAGGPGLRTPLDHPMSLRLVQTDADNISRVDCYAEYGGWAAPACIDTQLEAPIIVLPLANHDNNQHAENENIRLQNVWDAMSIYGTLLATFGQM